MKETLSETQFISRFRDIRPENFSGPALSVLFDYLEEMEEGMGEEMEFDPIAICCDFSELTEEEIMREYGEPETEGDDDIGDVIDRLQDETLVLPVHSEGTYIVQAF